MPFSNYNQQELDNNNLAIDGAAANIGTIQGQISAAVTAIAPQQSAVIAASQAVTAYFAGLASGAAPDPAAYQPLVTALDAATAALVAAEGPLQGLNQQLAQAMTTFTTTVNAAIQYAQTLV